MTTAIIYVERADRNGEVHELEIEVTGSHSFGTPAKLSGHPDTWYPAEPSETELESAVCKNEEYKHLFTELTDEEKEEALEAIREQAAFDAEPDYDDSSYDYDE